MYFYRLTFLMKTLELGREKWKRIEKERIEVITRRLAFPIPNWGERHAFPNSKSQLTIIQKAIT